MDEVLLIFAYIRFSSNLKDSQMILSLAWRILFVIIMCSWLAEYV